MFASPHISKVPSQAVGTYLRFFAALMNGLPVNALDPDAAAGKKRSARSDVLQGNHDPDSDSDSDGQITVVAVSSFDHTPPPLPTLDPRTTKRLASIPSPNHIASLFTIANKSDTVLLDFVVFLLSLVIVWPSQRDKIYNTVVGLGSGGIIRMLYRQYVLRSQLGRPNTSLNGMSCSILSFVYH